MNEKDVANAKKFEKSIWKRNICFVCFKEVREFKVYIRESKKIVFFSPKANVYLHREKSILRDGDNKDVMFNDVLLPEL